MADISSSEKVLPDASAPDDFDRGLEPPR
jgi:hypothetical protein